MFLSIRTNFTQTHFQELFFEVQRQKTHILADVRENGTAADIKKIISSVLQVRKHVCKLFFCECHRFQVPTADVTLKKPNESQTSWETLDASKPLLELGYSTKNAKPDEPAILAFVLPGLFFDSFSS